jgi:hypothetical protein
MSEDALAISLVMFIGRDHPLSQRLIEDYGASVWGDYSASVDCFIDVNELMDMRAPRTLWRRCCITEHSRCSRWQVRFKGTCAALNATHSDSIHSLCIKGCR